ncbi:MAG: hypothetical protein AB7O45_00460 [Alphaproteobacteria bacterium]
MIVIEDRGERATVVAFSGLAPRNHIFEWATALADVPANFIGIRDPDDCWYMRRRDAVATLVWAALGVVGTKRSVFVGGSAGGFAALLFGRMIGADAVVAFCPQSACGAAKRALGDDRWPKFCLATPAADIAGRHPGAVIHYAADDDLDVMHAGRLDAERREWPAGGHNLPRVLKDGGHLSLALNEALT